MQFGLIGNVQKCRWVFKLIDRQTLPGNFKQLKFYPILEFKKMILLQPHKDFLIKKKEKHSEQCYPS